MSSIETNIEQSKSNVIRLPINQFIPSHANKLSLGSYQPKFDGPVSEAMVKKSKALKSAYNDHFDYRIYDALEKRFQSAPARGGAIYRGSLKLVNYHPTCTKCHYALELDTYGRGCVHDCVYCYAKHQLTRHGYWNNPIPFPIDILGLRKIFYKVFETSRPSKWRAILENRVPLRIGSMSDSFMWIDRKYQVTLELLKILKFYRYPYVIFTRSDLVAHDQYLEQMDSTLASIQLSIAGADEDISKKLEPGAPSIEKRLSATQKLSKNGFWVAVRLNPLFPTYPDGYFTRRDDVKSRFNRGEIPKFSLLETEQYPSFMQSLKDAGVQSLVVGFVRLGVHGIASIRRTVGVDLGHFFSTEEMKANRDKVYSSSEVNFYYTLLNNACQKVGIRFSSCYIGNGIQDYYRHQSLWANKQDCCDIVGRVTGFKTTSQAIPWSVRENFSKDKITIRDGKQVDSEAPLMEGSIAHHPTLTQEPTPWPN